MSAFDHTDVSARGSVIYCFQSLANFPLALSFSHETVAKAFLVRTSGPKGQAEFWQNTVWEFSIFALWVREPPYVFIFPLLWTCAFTCSLNRCATNRVRGVAGILFRIASRQTATITTSCFIWSWPHEILKFTTSTFPSFYSAYILTHFQVFTVQSQGTQLTTLCAGERGYMSNTSSLLFLSWIGRRGGSDVFVWVFLKSHALIHSRKREGHDFFRQKNSKITPPPP